MINPLLGIICTTWDGNFENSPTGGSDPGLGDDKIREFKQEVRKRIGNEHGNYENADSGADGTQAADWVHKKGSARAYYQSDAPTLRPDGATSLGANDDGRIWISNGNSPTLMVWDGSAWTSTSIYVKDLKHNSNLLCKILTGGSWNMDTTASNIIQHGINSTSIRCWRTLIRRDSTNQWNSLERNDNYTNPGAYDFMMSDVLVVCRHAGKFYDGSLFNSTGFDRAKAFVWYV